VLRPLRVLGMIVMLAGSLAALFAYLIPLLERLPQPESFPEVPRSVPREW